MSNRILVWIIAAEGVALLTAVSFFLLYGLYRDWLEVHHKRLVAKVRRLLVRSLESSAKIPASSALLCLPSRLQVRVLLDVATPLSYAERQRLLAWAQAMGVVSRAEGMLRSRFWWRRLHAARLFTVLGATSLTLESCFCDSRADIRTQACEWAATNPSPAVVRQLMELLGDAAGLCRFTVQDSLVRIGSRAVEPLESLIRSASGTKLEAALQVAAAIADSRFLSAGLLRSQDPSSQVRALAAKLLGNIGGSQAVSSLRASLADPHYKVRAAAASSLGRLQYWPAAVQVGMLLQDSSWEVRKAAGSALKEMGPPGLVTLRCFLSGSDRFASDMARHILEAAELEAKC